MTSSFRIALAEATDCNMNAILHLIRQASGWLKDMGTDQWQEAWPDVVGRDARVRRGLEVGATWIVWQANEPPPRLPSRKIPTWRSGKTRAAPGTSRPSTRTG